MHEGFPKPGPDTRGRHGTSSGYVRRVSGVHPVRILPSLRSYIADTSIITEVVEISD